MRYKLCFVLLMLLVLTGLSACKKEVSPPFEHKVFLEHAEHQSVLIVETAPVTEVIKNTALAGGSVKWKGSLEFVIARGICYNVAPNPKAYGTCSYIEQEVQSYGWTGKFVVKLTNLIPGTVYYVRAFVATMTGSEDGDQLIEYGNEITFTAGDPKSVSSSIIYNPDLNPNLTWGSVSDIDGNTYKTVQIGTQTWMAENLKTTRFNDGSHIFNIRWYDNDIVTYKNKYGGLYDHYTVNTGNICPTGWHVPSDEEWKQLEMALGMSRASADTSYGDFDVYGMGYRGTNQGTQMKATSGWIPWEGRG